mmetsp:Transcript_13326/g.19596  ORF Transcript_13326/g.19596 Transcript_13326/m.19596 type:complete len:440 (+) Transcript_13326:133-1452(+)|eukprot:CAMPEP_0194224244 /NCGR_PEP_ID=MMETSP0156-20130528/36981_1 /TAXON_ID=33649 /ORGANISM="Thalassionema nitzschioides, Strain L26-B" /LENGTH=439 /DNA_ID=CAMNT_0038955707 /DNA_START=36 /DNA_END=1355 /DNA_ORIENTATION=-
MSLVAVGLDLSSLYCRVAIDSRGVVSNTQGARYTLALVAKEEDENSNDFIFGDAALRLASHKTLLESILNDNDAAQAYLGYLIQLAANNTAASADHLRMVVAVPTSADDEQISKWVELITASAKSLIADKKKRKHDFVVGVVNKAAAVCLAHGVEKKDIVLVADMDGNDAMSLTLMECKGGSWYVQKQYETLDELSGPALVKLLANFVATQFERQQKIPRGEVMERKKARNKLRKEVERALLSGSSGNMTFTLDGLYDGLDCHVTVSKPRWEMMIGSLFRKMEAALTSKKESETITKVLCNGAWASLLQPTLQKVFSEKFKPSSVSSEEAVVIGCAKQAGFFIQKDGMKPIQSPTVVLSACPVSIGTDEGDEEWISEGAPLPAKIIQKISKPCHLIQLSPCKKELAKLEGFEGETSVTVELSIEGKLSIGLAGQPVVVI